MRLASGDGNGVSHLWWYHLANFICHNYSLCILSHCTRGLTLGLKHKHIFSHAETLSGMISFVFPYSAYILLAGVLKCSKHLWTLKLLECHMSLTCQNVTPRNFEKVPPKHIYGSTKLKMWACLTTIVLRINHIYFNCYILLTTGIYFGQTASAINVQRFNWMMHHSHVSR